jgi:hypothetical protein
LAKFGKDNFIRKLLREILIIKLSFTKFQKKKLGSQNRHIFCNNKGDRPQSLSPFSVMKRIILLVIYFYFPKYIIDNQVFMNKFYKIFSLIFLLSIQLKAQDLNLLGINPNYSQTGSIVGNLGYNLNIASVSSFTKTVNNKEFLGGQAHFVAQMLLIQKLNKNFAVGLGYGYGNHNIFGLREVEDRLIGQTSFVHNFGKFTFNHRLRYEYRTPLNLKTNIKDDASILRYQTFLTYPFYNPKESKKGFYLTASNEAFFYLKGATNGPVSSKNGEFETIGTSEDWLHVAGGYNMGKARVELGYCFQTLIRNPKLEMRNLNLAQINVFINLNWEQVQNWWYL